MLLCQSPVLSWLHSGPAPLLRCCGWRELGSSSPCRAGPSGGAFLLAEGSHREQGPVLLAMLRAPHVRSVFPGGCRLELKARPGHPGSLSTIPAAFRFQNLAS